MANYIKILLILLGLSVPVWQVFAQDETPVQTSTENPQAENGESAEEEVLVIQEDAPEDAGQETIVASDEDFTPSVQISEDLSVSFPVDI